MKQIKNIVTAALASSFLSLTAFADGTDSIPQVEKVVNPTGLSRQHLGATVQLSFTVDERGQPQDVAVVSPADRKLTTSVVDAVSQWRFSPAMQDGLPVAKRVTMPLQIADGRTIANANRSNELNVSARPLAQKIVNPAGLSRQHLGVTVQLSFTVDENGRPQDVEVVGQSDRQLTESVVAAVTQWRFTPAMQDGAPVSMRVTMPLQIQTSS